MTRRSKHIETRSGSYRAITRMVHWGVVTSIALVLVVVMGSHTTQAQYIKLDTPFQTNTESYFERMGVDFGFSMPGRVNANGNGIVGLNPDGSFTSDGSLRFTQNGSGSAVPPFGGYDPNTDATFGFARIGPNGGGYQLGLRMGQGNTRTSTMQTPTIVVPNGIGGSINDTIQRPFVTGIIPVVGGFPRDVYHMMYSPGPPVSPLDIALSRLQQDLASGRAYRNEEGQIVYAGDEGLTAVSTQEEVYAPPAESTANYGDLSVAEIRRQRESAESQQQAADQAQIEEWIQMADESIAKRNYGAARIFLRRAARLAEGELKQELLQRMESIQ